MSAPTVAGGPYVPVLIGSPTPSLRRMKQVHETGPCGGPIDWAHERAHTTGPMPKGPCGAGYPEAVAFVYTPKVWESRPAPIERPLTGGFSAPER